ADRRLDAIEKGLSVTSAALCLRFVLALTNSLTRETPEAYSGISADTPARRAAASMAPPAPEVPKPPSGCPGTTASWVSAYALTNDYAVHFVSPRCRTRARRPGRSVSAWLGVGWYVL